MFAKTLRICYSIFTGIIFILSSTKDIKCDVIDKLLPTSEQAKANNEVLDTIKNVHFDIGLNEINENYPLMADSTCKWMGHGTTEIKLCHPFLMNDSERIKMRSATANILQSEAFTDVKTGGEVGALEEGSRWNGINNCATQRRAWNTNTYEKRLRPLISKIIIDVYKDISSQVSSWFPKSIFASAFEHNHLQTSHSSHHHNINDLHGHQKSNEIHHHKKHKKKKINHKKAALLQIRRKKEMLARNEESTPKVFDAPLMVRKLLCKYRKSCYKTGIRPSLKSFFGSQPSTTSLPSFTSSVSVKDIKDENEEQLSDSEIRLFCRYRHSCYKEIEAELENKKLHSPSRILTSKRHPKILSKKTQKKTIQDIARRTLQKIEQREMIAIQRPIPQNVIIDRKLNEISEKMKKRLSCKYRKSCYESGIKPQLPSKEPFATITFFFKRIILHKINKPSHTYKAFDDLDEYEKRLYCKYRRSCYETGKKPIIEHHQLFKYEHAIQKNEKVIPLVLKCKYRRSCYQTGVVPDLRRKDQTKTEEISKVKQVLTVMEFKLHCRYRKSCYRLKAEETKNITSNNGMKGSKEIQQKVNATTETPILTTSEFLFNETKRAEKNQSRKMTETIIESKKQKNESTKNETIKYGQKTESKSSKKSVNKEELKQKEPHIKKINLPKYKKLNSENENKESSQKLKVSKNKTVKSKVKVIFKKEKLQTKPLKEESFLPKAKKIRFKKLAVIYDETIEKSADSKKRLKKSELKKKYMNKSLEKPKIIKEFNQTKPIKANKQEREKKKLLSLSFTQPPKLQQETKIKQFSSIDVHKTESEKYEQPKKVNITDESLTPTEIKLLCKYRKSCYENGDLSTVFPSTTIQHLLEKEVFHKPLELRCKYRKSCYETGILPDVSKSFEITHLIQNKKHQPIEIRCKYRKSCYKTGKYPVIDQKTFSFPTIQYEKFQTEIDDKILSEKDKKLRCKYRKSCYETGILHTQLNQTVKNVVSTVKDRYSSPQLKCKYRKSCYVNMNLFGRLTSDRNKKQRKPTEGVADHKITNYTQGKVKYVDRKEKKKQERNEDEEKRPRKGKKAKTELESDYMQVETQDMRMTSQTVASRTLSLTKLQKLKCKYRFKCYNGTPLQEVLVAKRRNYTSIKNFKRSNGATCNIYYISCRKLAGLPIKERAPIGPNGRRLCRKKKDNFSEQRTVQFS